MSSAPSRKALALLLCIVLAGEGAGSAAVAATAPSPEPCLLLKYAAPSVSEASARDRMAPLPALLLKDLDVRWVAPPSAGPVSPDPKSLFPDPDDTSLERISGKTAEALRRMDRMDTGEAAALLLDAEKEARKYRFGEATRALFSEIFLRRGQLHLWEGDPGKAGEWLARAKVLRPGFSPDPGLFSPAFLDAWNRAGDRPPPEAELLVQTLPPGATVYLDGKPAGATPGRVKVSSSGPVRVRIERAGYQAVEKAGQWLPGDSERIEIVLARDRTATLGDLLAESPEGKGTGPLLAELAAGAGASRVALLVLGEREGEPVLRVFASAEGSADPVFLGQFEWTAGEEGAVEAAGRTAKLLRNAGWPVGKGFPPGDGEAAWYHKWWVWLLIGAAAFGVAAGAGGGSAGGSAGSSTGTIGVAF